MKRNALIVVVFVIAVLSVTCKGKPEGTATGDLRDDSTYSLRKSPADEFDNRVVAYLKDEGLIVQREDNGAELTWAEADAYCRNLELSGKKGWRLPTEDETLRIIKTGLFKYEKPYAMWTSTKKGETRAITVGVTSGSSVPLDIQYKGDCRARCIYGDAK